MEGLKTFKVTAVQTEEVTREILAETEEEAMKIARDRYNNWIWFNKVKGEDPELEIKFAYEKEDKTPEMKIR